MRVDPVTRRYADALYELAVEKDQLAAVRADVEALTLELDVPGVTAWLLDARVEPSERRSKFGLVTGSLSTLTQNFVQLLFDKHREAVLADFGAAFQARIRQEQGIAEGVVESPRPLGAGELAELEVALGARLEKRVVLDNRMTADLVAGVRVTVDNRMIDYSVQGRLDELRRKLLEAPLPTRDA